MGYILLAVKVWQGNLVLLVCLSIQGLIHFSNLHLPNKAGGRFLAVTPWPGVKLWCVSSSLTMYGILLRPSWYHKNEVYRWFEMPRQTDIGVADAIAAYAAWIKRYLQKRHESAETQNLQDENRKPFFGPLDLLLPLMLLVFTIQISLLSALFFV